MSFVVEYHNSFCGICEHLESSILYLYLQVTIGMSDEFEGKSPEDIDLMILRNVRRTAGRSKEMVGELKNLKAKVYGLENDLKHL